MKICYIYGNAFGAKQRTSIVLKALKKNNVDVVECSTRKIGLLADLKSLVRFIFKKRECDLVLAGFVSQYWLWLIRLLTRKKIIFDGHISAYETLVTERGNYNKRSLKAKLVHALEKSSCKLSDKILIDTNEMIKFFVEEYKINKEKFSRNFESADTDIFYPRNVKKRTKNFVVLYHGMFLPLHGVNYILEAAKILENDNIEFWLSGRGITLKENLELAKKLNLKNVKFLGFTPGEEVPLNLARCDVGLGIFNIVDKNEKITPNKIFELIAMKKPVITMDAKAIHELLEDKKSVLLCKPADPADLARKILELKNDKKLREKIAVGGYEAFKKHGSLEVIGKEIKEIAEGLINEK